MGLKQFAAKIFAKYIVQQTAQWANEPIATQEGVFAALIAQARHTQFGKDHGFDQIKTHEDFVKSVPVRDYEDLKPYVQKVVAGEKDVLWPGQPAYFAKTSGTTSGAKYIPITKVSIQEQVKASRDAILHYIHQSGNSDFVTRKMIFLQGSPVLDTSGYIPTGRLSGISAHYVPSYLQRNRLPSWETNCIEDWETKVDAVVQETITEDMGVIAGIPSWVQMYFERLKAASGKPIGDLFKHFKLFIYGGVNYEPYRANFENLIGRKVDTIELFPASEGFFAYQDLRDEKGMLLLLNSGIFYEFIPADQFFEKDPPRLTIGQVSLGVNYVLILSTNAGLWGYNIGDTVQFTSLKPYRVIVSGRIKHFISAFGEHVIAKEVEYAMQEAIEKTDARVLEFTVAPQIAPSSGLPYHEWLVAFEKEPSQPALFSSILDQSLQDQNSYYKDLIVGKVLQGLKITSLPTDAFTQFMKTKGKLGGQNKVQRLANDREIADALLKMKDHV
jgi:hypothetical protein